MEKANQYSIKIKYISVILFLPMIPHVLHTGILCLVVTRDNEVSREYDYSVQYVNVGCGQAYRPVVRAVA